MNNLEIITDNWLLGGAGFLKIQRLSDRLFDLKVDEYLTTYKGNDKSKINYHPFIDLLKNSKQSSVLDIKSLCPSYLLTEHKDVEQIKDLFYTETNGKKQFLYADIDFKILTEKIDESKRNLFKASIQLLEKNTPDIFKLFKHLIRFIVPVISSLPRRGLSSTHALGSIFMSVQEREFSEKEIIQTATDIAHELGHNALMVYQHSDEIIMNGSSTQIYSCIRRTNRPAILSLHACVANVFMTEVFVTQDVRYPDLEEFYLLRNHEQDRSLKEILSKCQLTLFGTKILEELVYLQKKHSVLLKKRLN